MSESNCTNPKTSADCGQRLESTAHEATRKTGEAITKSNEELAHGHPSASQVNERPVHEFNESSGLMKETISPMDPPKTPEPGDCCDKTSEAKA
eukprot:gene14221-16349_t